VFNINLDYENDFAEVLLGKTDLGNPELHSEGSHGQGSGLPLSLVQLINNRDFFGWHGRRGHGHDEGVPSAGWDPKACGISGFPDPLS
jgi:hypothetical protein